MRTREDRTMRLSDDEVTDGVVWNGYDYQLQVWVRHGVVLPCSHPARMRGPAGCCDQSRYAGQRILSVPGHERRVGER